MAADSVISITCPSCGTRLKGRLQWVGESARCGKCDHEFIIAGVVSREQTSGKSEGGGSRQSSDTPSVHAENADKVVSSAEDRTGVFSTPGSAESAFAGELSENIERLLREVKDREETLTQRAEEIEQVDSGEVATSRLLAEQFRAMEEDRRCLAEAQSALDQQRSTLRDEQAPFDKDTQQLRHQLEIERKELHEIREALDEERAALCAEQKTLKKEREKLADEQAAIRRMREEMADLRLRLESAEYRLKMKAIEDSPTPEKKTAPAEQGKQSNPQHMMTRILLGDLLRDQGNVEDAVREYEAAATIARWNALPLEKLGETFSAEGMLHEAMSSYRAAIARDPKRSESYSALGRIHMDQKRYEESIEMYRAALALEPDSSEFAGQMARAVKLVSEDVGDSSASSTPPGSPARPESFPRTDA